MEKTNKNKQTNKQTNKKQTNKKKQRRLPLKINPPFFTTVQKRKTSFFVQCLTQTFWF